MTNILNSDPSLQMHANYQGLVEKAEASHARNRSPMGITTRDIDLARLYSYAFRLHTIGAFHATGLAILAQPSAAPLAMSHRKRAVEILDDLSDQAMEPIADDFRVVIATFARYHRNVIRVLESLENDFEISRDAQIRQAGQRFREIMEEITGHNGIHLTQDTSFPQQDSFIVPGLGITIVPLVYGDHHSWNLAYMSEERSDVPMHIHHSGVEIHLGYAPLKGMTILGDSRAAVSEGYVMPIAPGMTHGYVNNSEVVHHVPFIFGSLLQGGWGVFLDVEAQQHTVQELTLVPRDCEPFKHMVYVEREIAKAQALSTATRWVLVPASATDRCGSGGLELSVSRITESGSTFPVDYFRIVSVVRGAGEVRLAGMTRAIRAHDHFGIPTGMSASLTQIGPVPLVVLDVLIKVASP